MQKALIQLFCKASYAEAQELCKSRQMSLMSLETEKENSALTNFLGGLGAKNKKICVKIHN